MAKRTVFLHLGPSVPGVGGLHEALGRDPALAAAGVALPGVDQELMDRADVEIRRRHTAVGVRRKDVEGAWAKVCRRTFKIGGDVLLSQPGFVDATPEQAALAADGLAGMRLHLVLTPAAAPDAAGLADLVGPWAAYVRRPSRVHVLRLGDGPAVDELGAGFARLVLLARQDEVERRLVTLAKQRRGIRWRLGRVDAA
jgi:hypothetical protein